MLACNRLRIDPGSGSPIIEYKFEQGHVESRTLSSSAVIPSDTGWQRLTPEQLSSHVLADTVVAHWLRRRMGLHALLRACTCVHDYPAQATDQRVAA